MTCVILDETQRVKHHHELHFMTIVGQILVHAVVDDGCPDGMKNDSISGTCRTGIFSNSLTLMLEAEIIILCPTYQKKNHLVQNSVLER